MSFHKSSGPNVQPSIYDFNCTVGKKKNFNKMLCIEEKCGKDFLGQKIKMNWKICLKLFSLLPGFHFSQQIPGFVHSKKTTIFVWDTIKFSVDCAIEIL